MQHNRVFLFFTLAPCIYLLHLCIVLNGQTEMVGTLLFSNHFLLKEQSLFPALAQTLAHVLQLHLHLCYVHQFNLMWLSCDWFRVVLFNYYWLFLFYCQSMDKLILLTMELNISYLYLGKTYLAIYIISYLFYHPIIPDCEFRWFLVGTNHFRPGAIVLVMLCPRHLVIQSVVKMAPIFFFGLLMLPSHQLPLLNVAA